MLSPRQKHSTDTISKDVDGRQVPNRSASPMELNGDEPSAPNSLPITAGESGLADKDDVKHMTSAAEDCDKNSANNDDDDSEFFCKPVRRGIALAQEIHDQYLICKICLEDYKSPKCLDCMHTFCEECIENHAMSESSYKKYSDYREFTCPLCRKRTQLPLGGVRKLPDNHLVSGLMKSVAKRRPLTPIMSFIKCEICRSPISYFRSSSLSSVSNTTSDGDPMATTGTGNPVAARCLDCCKVMCASCVAVHRSTAVTRSHSVYDPDVLADILKDPNALACREHCNETVEYYCVDCRRCVCLLCAFDAEAVEPHVTHELIDFDTAADRHHSALSELCDTAAKESDRLESELADMTTYADNVDTVRRQIQLTAESFRRMIDAEERTLLDRLDAMYSSGISHDNGRAVAASMKECVGRLGAVRRLAETVAARRGVELLLLHEEVENRLRREQQLVNARQQRGGSTDASGRGTGMAAELTRKRVQFVPGVVNLGSVDWMEGGTTTGCGSGGRNETAGCCPTCRRRSAIFRDQSTMTVGDGTVSTASKQDKAVNTRARGLLHSGGGNGSSTRTGSGKSQSLTSSIDGTLAEQQESQQLAVE